MYFEFIYINCLYLKSGRRLIWITQHSGISQPVSTIELARCLSPAVLNALEHMLSTLGWTLCLRPPGQTATVLDTASSGHLLGTDLAAGPVCPL